MNTAIKMILLENPEGKGDIILRKYWKNFSRFFSYFPGTPCSTWGPTTVTYAILWMAPGEAFFVFLYQHVECFSLRLFFLFFLSQHLLLPSRSAFSSNCIPSMNEIFHSACLRRMDSQNRQETPFAPNMRPETVQDSKNY